MRSWTVPLSSWRWASAACCMGMDLVRAQAEPAIGQQGDRLIQGTGSTVGRGLGQRDAEVSGGRVGQGDDPLGSASQGDRVGQDPRAGRVEHGVDRAQRADPAGQARAVPHRRGSQLAGERFVVLADRADHRDPPGDRELRGDDADRSAAAEQQQRLTAVGRSAAAAHRRPPRPSWAARRHRSTKRCPACGSRSTPPRTRRNRPG